MGAASQLFLVPALSAVRIFRGLAHWLTDASGEGAMSRCVRTKSELSPRQNSKFLLRYPHTFTHQRMNKKPSQKTFRLTTILAGHIIDGTVVFSPAPQPGILTELAKFEAERILAHMVSEDITAGRL
jgi:hypothetical protein